jgi:hypothetical protein
LIMEKAKVANSSSTADQSLTDRPLGGVDIPRFQGRHGLDKDDVCYHLGISHYQKKCSKDELDYSLELLMRLFDEDPTPAPFKRDRISLPALFDLMYGKRLAVFAGTEHEVEAKVDLQNRFSKLLGRSKGRAYRWLDATAIKAGSARTHSDIIGVLGKLTQRPDPGETLERLGSYIWALRGVDIDKEFPIPTRRNPPKRGKRGRRPINRDGASEEAKPVVRKRVVLVKKSEVVSKPQPAKKAAAKKPTAKKPAAKKTSTRKIK